MSELFKVSSNPHIRSRATTNGLMLAVIIALMPAAGFGIYNFGARAIAVILVTIASTVLTEFLFGVYKWVRDCSKTENSQWAKDSASVRDASKAENRSALGDRGTAHLGENSISKQKRTLRWEDLLKKMTITDLSAVVTGLLLSLNLPATIPLWMAALGGVFAILVVKMLFGGLGQNFMNPALAARCFLLLSFPTAMTTFDCDIYTGATPLAALKAGEQVNTLEMFIGHTAGTIGETSVIALLIGACFLLLAGVIDLRIPGSYIVTFVLFVAVFGGHGPDPVYLAAQVSGGGLMLGAFFMATDYVTRPITIKGQYVFGIFLGLMTGIFRIFGPGAEGVSYAIILGNLLVPLIEKFTKPTAFGYQKGGKHGEK